MNILSGLKVFNGIFSAIFAICYLYQFVYILIGCARKTRRYPETKQTNRYAIVISARNESGVIGYLLDSIRAQDYPSGLLDAYVVADNCGDDTAGVAAAHGATVYERRNKALVGKGYALNFLFDRIFEARGRDYYDAYFVIDADNLLDPGYVTEMDKCFCSGYRIVTSYRNSKNYGDNWISSGYALWFLHEARHLNGPRSIVGTSCAVSGTGFMVSGEIIRRQNGWKHHLLTEDIEFSVDNVLGSEVIGYCGQAMLYDEQPVTFIQSWHQRLRWSKGFLQVVRHYGAKLARNVFSARGFSSYDLLMTIAPAFFISLIVVLADLGALAFSFLIDLPAAPIIAEMFSMLGGVYLTLFVVGTLAGVCEWRNIRCSAPKKIKSFFTFPFFMLTYLPISIAALFKKVGWTPILHSAAVSYEQMNRAAGR